ncbi:MAG: imidazolonepropionase [Bacillota bacterium]
MLKLFSSPDQIVTVNTNGINFKNGDQLNDIGLLEGYSIVVEDETIKDLITNADIRKYSFDQTVDLTGKVVLPGLIDCHTHTVFAGSRAEEFRMKIAGVGYEEIAKSGGGIIKTVGSLRKLSQTQLKDLSGSRIRYAISRGITTLEIKSGYGLNFENEIKILKTIQDLNQEFEIDIVPTFLGAHTYPKEYKDDHEGYLNLITERLLPYIANEGLAEFCDVFCETTAFSTSETERVLMKAASLGFKLKLHTEQFNRIGGVSLGLKYNVYSLDHLEMISDEDIEKAASAETVCVLLPGVSFFLKYGYAPARELIKKGAVVALSTDYNPGSSHIADIGFIMSLAAIQMRMTIEEVISSVTINAAKALDRNSVTGSIEIGKKADFSIFDTSEYPDIVYNVAKNLNVCTVKNGKIIYKSS